ncbi:aromatic acid exporter family protein [Alkalibacterium putridalgicola]|uniref:aromatic acid exporter family protein n=1 Tax=Alkalibacterium putridalgicola TaxID=426703 RepID=UPI0034CFD5E9
MTIKLKTIKIVLATFISILIAQALGLEYPMAAGIIAILSVLDTKKESIATALQRLASTVVAFFIASVIFYLFGFSVLTFSLYLLFYVPVAYRYNLQSGIAPCSVLVTHFVIAESIALYWQINGLLLMTIGAVIAIIFNLWMPSYEKDLNQKIRSIEEELRQFLSLFHTYLMGDTAHQALNAKARKLADLLEETEQIALLDHENQLVNYSDYYIKYTLMRERQLDILKVMIQNITAVRLETEQNLELALLFDDIANQLHETNPGLSLLDHISVLYRHFRQSKLPRTRAEFESRAILFQILRDIERFIEIKRDFFMTHSE